jgi:hypothetical protein
MSLLRIGLGSSGCLDRFFTDLDFRLEHWFLFGLDRFLHSDWIYQKYIGWRAPQSA